MPRATPLVAGLAAALLVVFAAPANTQPTSARRTAAAQTASTPAGVTIGTTIPRLADASLLVVFDDLARELRSPAGATLRGVLAELGLFASTAESWAGLSRAIGLPPADAIDGLLGGRSLLLARDVDAGAGEQRDGKSTPWACAMSVDPELGRTIVRSLKAAPRGIEGGRTVFAIEDGRLLVMPIADGSRLVVATPTARSLLASAATLSSAWDARASNESQSDGSTADGSTSKDSTTDTTADASRFGIIVYRPDSGPWVSGTLHALDGQAGGGSPGWQFRFTGAGFAGGASPTESARENGPAPAESPGIDRRWFDAVTADAGIAYAGPIRTRAPAAPATTDERRSSGVLPALPLHLGPLGDDLQNLRRWAQIFLPFEPPAGLLASDADFGIYTAGADRAGSVWLRVADAAHAAKVGDAHVCDLVGTLAGAGAVAADDPECSGRFPIAARSVSLPGVTQRQNDLGDLSFAWGAARVSTAPGSVGAGANAADPQAWWSMHSIPEGRRVPSLAPGLSADPDAPRVRFTLRPDRLIDQLSAGGLLSGIVSAAGERGIEGLRRVALIDLELGERTPARTTAAGKTADPLGDHSAANTRSTSSGSLTIRVRTEDG